MSDVNDCLAFLERLAAAGIPRELAPMELARMLAEAGIGGDAGAAILAGDVHSLAYLLDAPPTVCCLIAPGKEEEEEEEEPEEEEPEEEEDDEEAEPAQPPSRNLTARRAPRAG